MAPGTDNPLRNAFRASFGSDPQAIITSPGRVNLIGEHTDYNDGFVLPMAIDRATRVAYRPADNDELVLESLDTGERLRVDLRNMQKESPSWKEYPKAVANELRDRMGLRGWNGIVQSDIPMGAGLSSSASFELAVARGFAAAAGAEWDARAMASTCRHAEHAWIGVQCGIMDQLACAAGKAGHAMLIDCRSIEIDYLPMIDNMVIAIMDTGTRRQLTTSNYNQRRHECEEAARLLGADSLRDVDVDLLERVSGRFDSTLMRRARHVVTENVRVWQAAQALRRGDAAAFGAMMDRSHASLRDDYEVSSPALDAIVEAAHDAPGCLGARMTGAGFAGCAIAMVEAEQANAFVASTASAYRDRSGNTPDIFMCRAANGTEINVEQWGDSP